MMPITGLSAYTAGLGDGVALAPVAFAVVLRGTVLVMNLGGWAMLRGIERVYRQSIVRGALSVILLQTWAAFSTLGVELAAVSDRYAWMAVPSLALSGVLWLASLTAVITLTETMAGARFSEWRRGIWLGGGLVATAALVLVLTHGVAAAPASRLFSASVTLKVGAQLLSAWLVWTLVPKAHHRRRAALGIAGVLCAVAGMRPLSDLLWGSIANVASLPETSAYAAAQLRILVVSVAFNGFVTAAVVGLCLLLSKQDQAESQALITLLERISAGRRADADAGQFAVTVAHDLKNVLQATSLVAAGLRRTDEERVTYASLADTSHQLSRKLNRLLEFARTDPSAPSILEVGQFLERLQPIMDTLFVDRTLSVQLVDGGLLVRKNEESFERMVMELFEHARDHTVTGGAVHVEATRQRVRTIAVADNPSIPRVAVGEYACISVIDSGMPIPADALPTLFSPSTTVSDGGRGGLGLAWVRAHCRSVGGDLTVDANRATGAAIRLWIPIVAV